MKEAWKKELVVSFVLIVLLLNVSFVFAKDVAYVYKNKNAIDDNVVDVFEDAGLDVDFIQEGDIVDDLEDYRILFVGDERFRNVENIPVGKMSTIISNYYFGEEWGLTDYDGISKLASNSELKVWKDGNVVQVYTEAKYTGKSLSIPYYYLDDHNKVDKMQEVARTYTGGSYDFGDVISYAYPGTDLINGDSLKGRLCFFGIVESDFWTDDAKNMFEDCVGFVGLTCEKDSDCGDDETGDLYCDNGDVYQDEIEYECKNAGTIESRCEEDVDSVLIEECVFGCNNGACVNECTTDADCGSDYYGDNYCDGLNVVRDFYDVGCFNEACGADVTQEIVEVCTEACSNGVCVSIECFSDADCGTGLFFGEPFCKDENSWQMFRGFECMLPGTAESYCTYTDEDRLVEDCLGHCIRGRCFLCESIEGITQLEKPKNIADLF